MVLSWNEIKDRAVKFSKEWAGASNELADAKPFLIDFFEVFGISRRRVATFEHKVKKLDDHGGYIDLLWKGTILIEMKSRGLSLEKAYKQARDYLPGLEEYELPKYILVSDFNTFQLHDLEEDNSIEFQLCDLAKNVNHFGFLIGYQKKVYKEQDPANIKAAELMGKIHDSLKEIGYSGHPLEVYLVRLLFCLFAEDTTIFEKQQFQDYIQHRTNIDGSDLASRLQELFQILNTPMENRYRNLDEQLAAFPYVNGKLFEENLPIACFDSKMRQALLNCCGIDWSKISPAIFGSMFQSVMNPKERRNLGAHYTSEKNILKLIRPLFLDDLWGEFQAVRYNKNKLIDFHKKIRSLKFLDPACGCGNFLVISYRELRMLELEVLRSLHKSGQRFIDIGSIILLNVDQFFGIESEEFPARIAEVAMWLMDHQMNQIISIEFGQYYIRIPLRTSANIICANALQADWTLVVPKDQLNYILGNPPFIGSSYQTTAQKKDLYTIFSGLRSAGMLDYVSAWYVKASEMISNTKNKVAFVSTNSITQGEQPGVLWPLLFNHYGIKIHFAHRTFSWSNEGKSNAAVHVVIIGFANYDTPNKTIYNYDHVKSEPHAVKVRNINPYLVEGRDLVLRSISSPICNVPKMQSGSAARDGGYLILTDEEKRELENLHPSISKFFRRFISGDDFINNVIRWCVWLKDANPSEFIKVRELQTRFEEVRRFRENSTRAGTRKMSELPYLFAEERQPESDFLVVPKVSSENRKYIPIAYLSREYIVSDKTFVLPNTTMFHFGVLNSSMHMTWVKNTCGRLESRYSYSNTVVYNNFPWPQNPTEKQVKNIELVSQRILNARSSYSNSSLADLYNPLGMPATLAKAHQDLDRAVDLAYRPQPFTSEANRMEFLFCLYEKYTAGLFTSEKTKKRKSTKKNDDES